MNWFKDFKILIYVLVVFVLVAFTAIWVTSYYFPTKLPTFEA
jgi:hypothetical protein